MATNLGTANNFNVFVIGNQTQSNVDSEGRVAVGGIATLTNYGIGNTLPLSTTRADLIVGMEMVITSGTNFSGNSVISSTGTVVTYTMTNNNGVPGQPLVQDLIDFNTEANFLQCASTTWGALAPTGVATTNFGQIVLTGLDPTLNIFTFDGTNVAGTGLTLQSANGINIIAPVGSTILINITGDNIGFGSYSIFRNGSPATSTDAQEILYNFPDATNAFNQNLSIEGSVLAPFASWRAAGFGQINGTFIADSLTNTSGTLEAHNFPFLGVLPDVCSTTSTT
ncbi:MULTISPECIES: choice-of-anchor A family protein, partial [Bacillus cereus group]